MNTKFQNIYAHAPRGSGRFQVQSYVNVGGVAEKTPLWSGMAAADQPIGPCVVRFQAPVVAQSLWFHIEGSSGAADCSVGNGQHLDGYYTPQYVDVWLDPRVDTHVDMFGAAASRISWQIISQETYSIP